VLREEESVELAPLSGPVIDGHRRHCLPPGETRSFRLVQ
jgi:hypothetical protein